MIRRTLFLASVCLLFVHVSPAAAAGDDEAALLLAKHKGYVGWQYGDGSVRAIKLLGAVSQRQKDGSLKPIYKTEEYRAGLIYRRVVTNEKTGAIFQSGFTGNVFWNAASNGFTVPDYSESIKYDTARGVVLGELTTTLPAQVVKHDTLSGVPVVVLREQIPHAFPIDIYVDPSSGAYERVVFDPLDKPQIFIIDSYSEPVGGKRVVKTYHYDGSPDQRSFDTIELNGQVDAADFHPPKPAASWTFGSGSPVPIELRTPDLTSGKVTMESYRLYVNATVNGVPGRFILDTGAGAIALTRAFAKRAGLKRVSSERVGGLGSYAEMTADVDRADTIAFADGSTMHDVVVGSGLDFGDERADGLLGFDFMAGAIVALDLDAQRLQIFDPAKVTPSEDGAIVATPDLSNGTPSLPIVIDGTAKGDVLVDTGNPGFAILSSGYLTKVPVMIDNSSLASVMGIEGATGGSEIDSCGAIAVIALGPISYNHIQTCFSHNMDAGSGIIGLDFMKNFNFTLDYPDGKIYLYKRAH